MCRPSFPYEIASGSDCLLRLRLERKQDHFLRCVHCKRHDASASVAEPKTFGAAGSRFFRKDQLRSGHLGFRSNFIKLALTQIVERGTAVGVGAFRQHGGNLQRLLRNVPTASIRERQAISRAEGEMLDLTTAGCENRQKHSSHFQSRRFMNFC